MRPMRLLTRTVFLQIHLLDLTVPAKRILDLTSLDTL